MMGRPIVGRTMRRRTKVGRTMWRWGVMIPEQIVGQLYLLVLQGWVSAPLVVGGVVPRINVNVDVDRM